MSEPENAPRTISFPDGAEFEIAARPMRGPLVTRWRPRRQVFLWTLRAPAVLFAGLLVVFLGWTIVRGVMGLLTEGADVVAAGGGWAYVWTIVWVVVAVVVIVAGYLVASIGTWKRSAWTPFRLLFILPFAISAFVTGVAFRLLFQTVQGGNSTGQISAVALLGLAFAWTWLGFVTSLFRAGRDAIDADSAKSTYVRQAQGWRRRSLRRFHLLRPIAVIVGLTVGVAGARLFDIILVAIPSSMQYDVRPMGVHWWRLTEEGHSLEAAGFILFPTLLLWVVAVILQPPLPKGQSHTYGTGLPTQPRKPDQQLGHRRSGWWWTVTKVVFWIIWIIPIAVLVRGALVDPLTSDVSLDAFVQLWSNPELQRSLRTTLTVAVLATLTLVCVAIPIAYLLASRRPDTLPAQAIVTLAVLLAVTPVQAYVGPFRDAVNELGLSGTRIPLILLHVASGLPVAVLLLRGALLASKDTPAGDALYGLASPSVTLRRLWDRAGPALITVVVLELVQVWDDFIIGLFVSGPGASPLSLLLWGEARQFGISADSVAAGSIIFAVPPAVLVLLTWRRWIVPGITGGALR